MENKKIFLFVGDDRFTDSFKSKVSVLEQLGCNLVQIKREEDFYNPLLVGTGNTGPLPDSILKIIQDLGHHDVLIAVVGDADVLSKEDVELLAYLNLMYHDDTHELLLEFKRMHESFPIIDPKLIFDDSRCKRKNFVPKKQSVPKNSSKFCNRPSRSRSFNRMMRK